MIRNKKRQAEEAREAEAMAAAAAENEAAPGAVDSSEGENALEAEVDVDETAAFIAQIEAERDDAIGQYKRALADYHNFQKRSLQNEKSASEYARQDVIRDLIPVLDNFDLALAHGANESDAEADPAGAASAQLLQGVTMVHEALLQVLGNRGLQRLSAAIGDEFDPTCQEAVMMQPTDEVAPQHVLQVVQLGYRLNETVLRPTKVVVAQALPRIADVEDEGETNDPVDANEES